MIFAEAERFVFDRRLQLLGDLDREPAAAVDDTRPDYGVEEAR